MVPCTTNVSGPSWATSCPTAAPSTPRGRSGSRMPRAASPCACAKGERSSTRSTQASGRSRARWAETTVARCSCSAPTASARKTPIPRAPSACTASTCLTPDSRDVPALPTGTVTFLFTDIEGSTRLWEEQPSAMQTALARHDAILTDVVLAHGGNVVKTTGDGVHAVFPVAEAGVEAALDGQLQLTNEPCGVTGPIRVRMGLHTGTAELRDGDYYGSVLNRAARLMSVAHGGQVVISQLTEQLVRASLGPDVELVALGEPRLRDLAAPMYVFQVTHRAPRPPFPPLRSLDVASGNLPVQ